MSYDSNNVFAKILRGDLPAFKVFEDAHALAFMDVMPQSDGHTLVIPKTQAENLFDIDAESLSRLIVATQTVAKAVRRAFNPDGIRIAQFNGPAAGQTVFHIHFHIIPCYAGVDLKAHSRGMADKNLLAAHAEKVKQAIG